MTAGLDDRGVDVSLMQSPISSDVERYADTYTMGPSAAVSALPSQTQKVTPFPGMAGGVKEVRLLEGLMWTMGARRVLEIGTFTGATAMAFAEALPSHRAGITIDADETVASVARRHFAVSPHGTKIELHLGDARRDCENPRRPVRSRAWRDRGRQHAVVRPAVQWVRDRRRERRCARIRRARAIRPRTRHVRLTVGPGSC